LNRAVKNTRKNVSEKAQKNSFSSHWIKFVNHIHKSKNTNYGDDVVTDASVTLEEEDLTDSDLGARSAVTDTTVSMSVVSEI